jgi:hypothetical protein
MEEGQTEEQFLEALTGDGMYIPIRYHRGAPISYGAMSFDDGRYPWINKESARVRSVHKEIDQYNKQLVFFPEIVRGDSKEGGMYSIDVIALIAELVGRLQKDIYLMFESTNFSSLAIPTSVDRHVARADRLRGVTSCRMIDRLHTWCTISK